MACWISMGNRQEKLRGRKYSKRGGELGCVEWAPGVKAKNSNRQARGDNRRWREVKWMLQIKCNEAAVEKNREAAVQWWWLHWSGV